MRVGQVCAELAGLRMRATAQYVECGQLHAASITSDGLDERIDSSWLDVDERMDFDASGSYPFVGIKPLLRFATRRTSPPNAVWPGAIQYRYQSEWDEEREQP
jgi:hypothetical protein